jgi:hypothetical protein
MCRNIEHTTSTMCPMRLSTVLDSCTFVLGLLFISFNKFESVFTIFYILNKFLHVYKK